MKLKGRLANLEKCFPPEDEERRQTMIASIEKWFAELEVKACTDQEAQLYLEGMRSVLGRP
jgi:hypothetical protein